MALNTMVYDRKYTYNMISLTFWMFFCGKFVGYMNVYISIYLFDFRIFSFGGFLRSWLPFLIMLAIIVTITVVVKLQA